MPLSTGTVLNNRYRIVQLLGQNETGAVYRSWDVARQGKCVVKEYRNTSPQAAQFFQSAASRLIALRHPNLPQMRDHFALDGQGLYLVMDFIDGPDLQTLLVQGGALPMDQALSSVTQVCDALDYLERQQPPPLIHGNIKPANIRLTRDGLAVLVDLGVGRLSRPGGSGAGAYSIAPGYSPLEQYGSGTCDARSDIYALGAALYACLSGRQPPESVARAVSDPLRPARQINPQLPVHVDTALQRALQLDPQRRFQSAAEFKAALLQGRSAAPLILGLGLAASKVTLPGSPGAFPPGTASPHAPGLPSLRPPGAPTPQPAAPQPAAGIPTPHAPAPPGSPTPSAVGGLPAPHPAAPPGTSAPPPLGPTLPPPAPLPPAAPPYPPLPPAGPPLPPAPPPPIPPVSGLGGLPLWGWIGLGALGCASLAVAITIAGVILFMGSSRRSSATALAATRSAVAQIGTSMAATLTGLAATLEPATPMPTPTASLTPSLTASATPTPSLTASPTPSLTPSPTASLTPTSTPSATPTHTQSPSPTTTPSQTARPPDSVTGSVLIEGGKSAAGGIAGDRLSIRVQLAAFSTAGPVQQMRLQTSYGGGCTKAEEMNTREWLPYMPESSFEVTVALNWVGFYVTAQYRDFLGNLSPIYCDDISVEGMPQPFTITPTATSTPAPDLRLNASLSVPGYDPFSGVVNYTGSYDNLFVGIQAEGDWPKCSGSIDRVEVQPLYRQAQPFVEEFDSSEGFQQLGETVFISDGRVVWRDVSMSGGDQYVYRPIQPFNGPVRLKVLGQVDQWENNCGVYAGIGKSPRQGVSIYFGFFGGGCRRNGPIILTGGVNDMNYESDGCSFTSQAPWIKESTPYTAELTISYATGLK